MIQILRDLSLYIQKILHFSPEFSAWKESEELPFFLTGFYEFYELSLFNRRALLIIAKDETEITPTQVRKHLEQIKKVWPESCIYVSQSLSSFNRERLIQAGIAFITPGNQMYLPDFGIDLREYFLKDKKTVRTHFSPSTQAVIIFSLLNNDVNNLFTGELSHHLNYRVMTINRAFDELEAAHLGEIKWQGRGRYWTFSGTKKELWNLAKEKLRNPVKARWWVSNAKIIKKRSSLAGLSALSHYSDLNEPLIPVYATDVLLKDSSLNPKEVLQSPEGATAELEVWRYNPELFQKKHIVDPFSLYLSLQGSADERVEAALNKMMEKIKW